MNREYKLIAWIVAVVSTWVAMPGCRAAGESVGATHDVDDSYEVSISPRAEELQVQARFAAGTSGELGVVAPAFAFVRDVEVSEGDFWRALQPVAERWILPQRGRREELRVRYRFRLKEAAQALRDPDLAVEREGAFIAPPSTWLLHPLAVHTGRTFRLHVAHSTDEAFAGGLLPERGGLPDTFVAQSEHLDSSPYCAFGALRLQHVAAGGGAEVEVAILPGSYAVGDEAIVGWVARAVAALNAYYGRYPIEHALVIVSAGRGDSIEGGKTTGGGGAAIVIQIGRRAGQHALDHDWILTHEMVHIALPSLAEEHHWLEEGSATYVEPIARARAGQVGAEHVWLDLIDGIPQGLPELGDRGLDHTPTWGRVYWGGALFCLLADVEIRERTQGRSSLQDALAAIVRAGGNIALDWPIESVWEAGDRATGVPVLAELHARMGSAPMPVDIQGLWKRLGVSVEGTRVRFDDQAPLAWLRRAITEPSAAR